MDADPIAATITKARLDAGLSRRELADRAGVSESAVATLETGQHHPTLYVLRRVLNVLGLTLRCVPATPAPARPRLGPNDTAACPSRSCMAWHRAHGYEHDCRRNIPARSRVNRRALREPLPETHRYPRAASEEVA